MSRERERERREAGCGRRKGNGGLKYMVSLTNVNFVLGAEIIPSAPGSPSVEVLGPNSIRVRWEPPPPGTPDPEHYLIQYTTITR